MCNHKVQSFRAVGAGLAALLAAAIFLISPLSANAATIYDDVQYGGESYSSTSAVNVGQMSDRASSLDIQGRCTNFYDNQNYGGYKLRACENFPSLVSVRTDGMGWNIDWNDRITSFQ